MALDVIVRMTAQEAGAYRAWAEQQAAVGKLSRGMKDLEGAANSATGKMGALDASVKASGNVLLKLGAVAGKSGGLVGKLAAASTAAGVKLRELTTRAGAAGGKLGELGGKARGAKGEFGQFFESSIGRWTSVAGGIGLATAAMHKLIAANRQVREEEASATFTLDEKFASFRVITEMGEKDFPEAQRQLFGIADKTAVPVGTAIDAARELASAGNWEGGVLKSGIAQEFLSTMRASGENGQNIDVGELAEKTTQAILAQDTGKEGSEAAGKLNLQNLSQLVRATQALSLSHKIKFKDLGDLAAAAPAMANAGIDMLTQVALMARMRDVQDAADAGTSLRNIFQRLQSTDVSDVKVAALAKMGLKPGDVDLVGESLETVLLRLRAGYNRLPEEQRAGVFKQLFEERGSQGFFALMSNPELIAQYRAESQEQGKFDEAFKTATEHRGADKTRLENKRLEQRYGGVGATDELTQLRIETQSPDHPVLSKLAANAYAVGRWFNIPPEALQFYMGVSGGQRTEAETERRMKEMEAESRAEVQQLKRRRASAPAPAPDAAQVAARRAEFEKKELELVAKNRTATEAAAQRKKDEKRAEHEQKVRQREAEADDLAHAKRNDVMAAAVETFEQMLPSLPAGKQVDSVLAKAEAEAIRRAIRAGVVKSFSAARARSFHDAVLADQSTWGFGADTEQAQDRMRAMLQFDLTAGTMHPRLSKKAAAAAAAEAAAAPRWVTGLPRSELKRGMPLQKRIDDFISRSGATESPFAPDDVPYLPIGAKRRFAEKVKRDVRASAARGDRAYSDPGAADFRMVELLVAVLREMQQIAANTADKKVEIKNPGEAERRARRAQPAGPPTASLGR